MARKKLIFFFIVLNSFSVFGQIRKYSNEYLTIGISARSLAMGNATISNNNNLTAAYYNPSCLSNLQNNIETSFMHAEYFAGIAKYDYMGAGYKIDDSTGIGFAFIRLGIDNIQNTLFLYDEFGNINYDNIKLFSVADYAFILAFGKKSELHNLRYGGSAKIIYRSEGSFAKAYGLSIDVGISAKLKGFNMGASLSNATTGYTAWFYNIDDQMKEVFEQTSNELPHNSLEITMPILNTGISKYFKIKEKLGINSELGLVTTFDGKRNALISLNPVSLYPQLGIETNYAKIIYLRAGVNNFQLIPDFSVNADSTGNFYHKKRLNFIPSIGIGIKYKNFSLDYALTDIGNMSIALYSNIFSIGLCF